MAITLTNLLKQNLTFSSNVFKGPFYVDFAAAKASLVVLVVVVVVVVVVMEYK